MRFLPILAAVVAVAACSHSAPPARTTPSPQAAPPPLSPAQITARNTLLSADSALSTAANSSLHDALAAGAADSIVMLMPALPRIVGRDAVLAAIDSLNAVTNRTMSWHPIRAELSADGTRGYTYGYGRRVALTDTLTSVAPIQYLSFWQRDTTGWKLEAWMVSAGGPDAPSTAPLACAHPGPPEYSSRNDADAIATARSTDLDFSARSVKAGAGAAFAQYAAPDGASIGTGETEITCGRDAVAQALQSIGPGVLTWEPVVADAAPSGDLAFTSGDAIIHGEHGLAYSKYLTIWKRSANGSWYFVADGGNSAPPPAAP
ncbi:MAG TPA: nuclear transport factor 2 family protein [Gemmatimonadaceae bacterium]|jgi:ketosteroid isomerase-like protein